MQMISMWDLVGIFFLKIQINKKSVKKTKQTKKTFKHRYLLSLSSRCEKSTFFSIALAKAAIVL